MASNDIQDIERMSLVYWTERSLIAGETNLRVRSITKDITNEEIVLDPTGNEEILLVTGFENRDQTVTPAIANAYTADIPVLRRSLLAKYMLRRLISFSFPGELNVGTYLMRHYNPTGFRWFVLGVTISVGRAPTGASVLVDVNVDGTTLFTDQNDRPAIAATEFKGVATLDEDIVASGSYFTCDIDQVGSTYAGGDLNVQVLFYG